MRVLFFPANDQALISLLFAFAFFAFVGCSRPPEEQPVMPPTTHPLARDYIGFAVVNASFIHLLSEPGTAGISQAYLRRGTVVRIVERRQIVNRGNVESWILAENYRAPGSRTEASISRGWLVESLVEIYDSESRADTASRIISR